MSWFPLFRLSGRLNPASLARYFLLGLSPLIPLQATEQGDELAKIFRFEEKIGTFVQDLVPDTLQVSANGKRFICLAFRGEKQIVCVNGEESPEYEGVIKGSLHVSPDGKRWAYGAVRDGKHFAVIDGVEGPRFDGLGQGTPFFSPDGQHVVYMAKRGDDLIVILDGQEHAACESISMPSLFFSPDSKHLVYAAGDGEYVRFVYDGKRGPRYRNVAGPVFSPDSRHFAYVAMTDTSMLVVVDGSETKPYESFVKDSLRFEGNTRLHVLALRGNEVFRVQMDLQPHFEGLGEKAP